jgi:hypothetical protein
VKDWQQTATRRRLPEYRIEYSAQHEEDDYYGQSLRPAGNNHGVSVVRSVNLEPEALQKLPAEEPHDALLVGRILWQSRDQPPVAFDPNLRILSLCMTAPGKVARKAGFTEVSDAADGQNRQRQHNSAHRERPRAAPDERASRTGYA